MTQRKASFADDEWAAILALSGLPLTRPTKRQPNGAPVPDSEHIRAAICALAALAGRDDLNGLFEPRTAGGVRPGGFGSLKKQKSGEE